MANLGRHLVEKFAAFADGFFAARLIAGQLLDQGLDLPNRHSLRRCLLGDFELRPFDPLSTIIGS